MLGEFSTTAQIGGHDYSVLAWQDAFLIKYNEFGDTVKTITLAGVYMEEGRAIHVNHQGVYISGVCFGQITIADTTFDPGMSSVFLAKLNHELDHVEWVKTYSSPGGAHSEIFQITSNSEGDLLACGDYTTSLQVDDTLLSYNNASYKKPFVLSLKEIMTGSLSVLSNAASFNVFPNPSENVLNVHYSSTASIGSVWLVIRNELGQTVKEYKFRANEKFFEKRMDLRGQPKGIYFIEVTAGDKRSVKKIVLN